MCYLSLKQAWDIKGQRATLVCEIKEHKKPVTCFALFEQGDRLLSGSSDKTVRVITLASAQAQVCRKK